MSIMDGITEPVKVSQDDDVLVEDGVFGDQYPGLLEFLSRIRWKGENRQPGRLIVYCEAGKGCVCLSDKHTRQVAFYVADTIAEALEGVERQLQAGKCDWRKDKRGGYRG